MAEVRPVPPPVPQPQPPRLEERVKSLLPEKGPSAGTVIAFATLLPVGGILLAISGITLIGTLVGLAVSTPVFVIFSPILVPAAVGIGLAVLGFLCSGALGVTGLSSLVWILNYLRAMRGISPEPIESGKRRMPEAAGPRPKDAGPAISSRAQEGGSRA